MTTAKDLNIITGIYRDELHAVDELKMKNVTGNRYSQKVQDTDSRIYLYIVWSSEEMIGRWRELSRRTTGHGEGTQIGTLRKVSRNPLIV